MKVALYPRVSTQEQVKEGYSIGEQIERLNKYCDAMGWDVYKVYTDAGFSGANTDRPGLQAMIQDVKAGKVEKVVVFKLDRLSRSQLDTLYLIEKVFLANGVDFVSMNENFDTSTPFGRAMVGILAVFAQLEREQIKERMIIGKEGRAKEGLWHGGRQPIGYDYDPVQKRLIVNDFEALAVREAFEEFSKGVPINKIAANLRNKGYTHKHGKWEPTTIRKILINPLYIGKLKHKGRVVPGIHSAIIDEELFNSLQPILKERSQKFMRMRENINLNTYLTGHIYCERCGAKYCKQNGRKDYGYYCCYSRSKKVWGMVKDPNCKNENWRTDKLDNLVLDEIKKLSLDPEYIKHVKTKKAGKNVPDTRAVLQTQLDEIDRQILKYMELYAMGTINADLISQKTAPLNETREKLSNELGALSEEEEKMSEEDALEIVKDFEEVLENGDFDEIRFVVEQLIEKIGIDGEDVTIYWKFA